MKVVGLTGSIATGKSTVSNQIRSFDEYPVKIIDADKVSRYVQRPGKPSFNAIVKKFGKQVLQSDGTLDRQKLGEIVFNDEKARKILNKCTHPYIRRQMFQDALWYFLSGCNVLVLDVPLLFEGGLNRLCNQTVVVYAPEDVQLDRLMKRDSSTKEQAMSRITSQWPVAKKKDMADIVIDNSTTLESTKKQTIDMLRQLRPNALMTLLWRIILGPFVLIVWLIMIGVDALGF